MADLSWGLKRKRAMLADAALNDESMPEVEGLPILPGISDPSSLGDILDSNSDSSHSNARDGYFDSTITTPMTQSSPQSTPRHPSDVNKVFQCTFDSCSKAFNRPAKLEQHLRSHTNTRPFVCPHAPCTKSFLRDAHLKHHIKSAHSDIRAHACTWEGCEKRFLTPTRLRRHEAAHEGREKFKCPADGCGQTFRKHSTLQNHVAKVHDKVKPFICAFLKDDGKRCNAGFDTAYKLRDHEGRLHSTKRHVCTICSQLEVASSAEDYMDRNNACFSTYMALQEHIASDHPPRCTECGLECVSQATLRGHIEICHSSLTLDERKTHMCPQSGCEASFTKKGNLNTHIRTVHAEKRFPCDVSTVAGIKGVEKGSGDRACGDSFATKGQMIQHVRTAHLGLPDTKPAKSRKQKRAGRRGTSAMERLTGMDDNDDDIACPVPQCEWTFFRKYDLEQHLVASHAFSSSDIWSLKVNAASTNQAWDPQQLPGMNATFTTSYSLASGGASEESMYYTDGEHRSQDRFWLGGSNNLEGNASNRSHQWVDDEMEMRRLIDDLDG